MEETAPKANLAQDPSLMGEVNMLKEEKSVGRPPTYTAPRPRYQTRTLSLPRAHWDFLEALRDRRQDPTISDTVRNIINVVREQIESTHASPSGAEGVQGLTVRRASL